MVSSPVWASLILATVFLNTTAQILLKLGSGQSPLNLYLASGIASYGLSTIVYIFVLGRLNLSIAYPLVIGLTIIATTVAGSSLLGEKISSIQWIGIGLMIAGISATALGKLLKF